MTNAEKLAAGLHSYLYDKLIGRERNPIKGMFSAPPRLPREVVMNATALVNAIHDDKPETPSVIQKLYGQIMVAQTTGFLNEEAADQALAILDQIKEERKDS